MENVVLARGFVEWMRVETELLEPTRPDEIERGSLLRIDRMLAVVLRRLSLRIGEVGGNVTMASATVSPKKRSATKAAVTPAAPRGSGASHGSAARGEQGGEPPGGAGPRISSGDVTSRAASAGVRLSERPRSSAG